MDETGSSSLKILRWISAGTVASVGGDDAPAAIAIRRLVEWVYEGLIVVVVLEECKSRSRERERVLVRILRRSKSVKGMMELLARFVVEDFENKERKGVPVGEAPLSEAALKIFTLNLGRDLAK